MHSKLKLALAIVTSPVAAFQEILERKLLGDAFVIVGLTGLAAMIGAIARSLALGPIQLLVIGRDNPLTWIGLWMLYSLALWGLLKWVGNRTDYQSLLIVLGWSHVILLAHQTLGIIWGFLLAAEVTNGFALQFFSAIGLVLPIMYLAAVVKGIQVASGASFGRAFISYLLVWMAGIMALDLSYAQRLIQPFRNSPDGLVMSVLRLAPMVLPFYYLALLFVDPWTRGIEQLPRLIGGMLGLTGGLWMLAESLGWPDQVRNRRLAASAVLGAVLIAGYLIAWNTSGYYIRLIRAQRLLATEHYDKAAATLEPLTAYFTHNKLLPWGLKTKAVVLGDIGDIYYVADKPRQSVTYFGKFLTTVENDELFDKTWLARAHNGLGAAYDIQGKHDQAITEFRKASRAWPKFREPWVRMAVTYDRMDDYKKAIDSANHAVKKLNSNAPIAWIALLDAFTNTGDLKQARAALANLTGQNPDLAARVGKRPNDWKNAVSRLTAKDLEFPLEKEVAPAPERPAKAD